MIEFKQLDLSYANADVLALQSINLLIEQGELVVVLGASGCGKTSLLNLIAGFVQIEGDSLLLHGKPIPGPGPDRTVVFQKDALMPWLNVYDNIDLGPKFAGLDKEIRKAKIKEVLEWVDLTGFDQHYVYQLSGGMQQRVGIARALVADPEILLMDEPLGALDALTRQDIQKVILDLWKKTQKTIVMITHSVQEAIFMASKLVIMTPRPGRVHKQYTLDFSKQYLEGRDASEIKKSKEFLQLKYEVLDIIEENTK